MKSSRAKKDSRANKVVAGVRFERERERERESISFRSRERDIAVVVVVLWGVEMALLGLTGEPTEGTGSGGVSDRAGIG